MNRKGFSLIEVLLAVMITGIIALAIVYVHGFMSKHTVRNNDKIFATEKAIQVMEELRALVAGGEKYKINVLDAYDTGSVWVPVLTSNKVISAPDNPLSGNVKLPTGWKYVRQVSCQPMGDEPFARQVTVRIGLAKPSDPAHPEVLAETVSILRTIASEFLPTQVLDLYIICIENVPGWWSSLPALVPIFSNVIEDMQTRNPGLEVRAHWITRLAYGRDSYYTPFINDESMSNSFTMPWVYFYPDKMRDASNVEQDYYDANRIKGRINSESSLRNENSYTLADQYNHAVRYPDEVALYSHFRATLPDHEMSLRMLIEKMNSEPDSLRNAMIINLHGELLPLPPMRNYSDAAKKPDDYPYQRIVTHPEQLQYNTNTPVKLRVYPYVTNLPSGYVAGYGFKAEYYNFTGGTPPSDPFDPSNLKYTTLCSTINFTWASGTSPASAVNNNKFAARYTGKLHPKNTGNYTFTTNSDDGVRLYVGGTLVFQNWSVHSSASNTGTFYMEAGKTYDITLEYFQGTGDGVIQLYWSGPSLPQEFIKLDTIPVTTIYFPFEDFDSTKISVQKIVGGSETQYARQTATSGNEYSVTEPTPGSTLITLYDTPLIHSSSTIGAVRGGLHAKGRLYGMEYIPCPTTNDFSKDLVTNCTAQNTARWVITLDGSLFPSATKKMITMETRFGNDLTDGATQNFSNLSRTYAWIGTEPPFTERYQLMGDPRHCPYLDVKQAHRYNWYFTRVPDTSGFYSGFTRTAEGWGADIDIDIPRFFYIFRQALLNTQSIWSALNGFSYFYVGLGGEFGMDQAPFPSGLPVMSRPWRTDSTNTTTFIDEILGNPLRIIARTDNSWFSKYWLGELYDDAQYSVWVASGNVPTGPDNYYRARHHTNFGTFFAYDRSANTNTQGCSSFLNGTQASASGAFRHEFADSARGNITNLGLSLSAMFNMPLVANISARRPFILNYGTGDLPPGWSTTDYSSIRTTLSIPSISGTERTYYTSTYSGSYKSSSLIRVTHSTSTCYISASGLAPEGDFGAPQLGKFAFATVVRAFLDAGLYTGQDRITQIPHIDLTKPKITDTFNASTTEVKVSWAVSWKRWDGTKYTEEYSDSFSETVPLTYMVKYSNDSGQHWYNCMDESPAMPGVLETDASKCTSTLHDDDAPLSWSVVGKNRGSYIIRVECYRNGYSLHYSYDQIQIYLKM